MAILTGLFRITRDAELRHIPSGEAVVNLSLAFNWGVKKDANGFLPSTFVEAGLWGKRAESLAQYLEKGKQVCAVLEDVHIETFVKQDGSSGSKLSARVQSIEFVSTPRQEGDQPRQEATKPAAPRPTQPVRQTTSAAAGSGFEDMDDDIPF